MLINDYFTTSELGNDVVLCDASEEMLTLARKAIQDAGLADRITTRRCAVQDLKVETVGRFDLVVCHAVLEWLADPASAIRRLAALLSDHGSLSLMFYNRKAALLKRILRGDFVGAQQEYHDGSPPRGWGYGAIPLDEEVVREVLRQVGLQIRSKASIRMFHDHLAAEMKSQERLPDLLELEKRLRATEPYASLGQHIHYVCSFAP